MANNGNTEGAENPLEGSLDGRHDHPSMIIHSEKMKEVMRRLAKVAPTNLPILIYGETGTGKEHVAYEAYSGSKRNSRPYHALSCACIPKDLLESELFGHERGAYTSAASAKRGILELAHGGTLFLDEIEELPLELQPKILRVLDHGRFWRVGGRQELAVDVRIIAAANQDLRQLIAKKRFRADLYHRLNGVTLAIPPLRERPEDILPLAYHFMALVSGEPEGEKLIPSLVQNYLCSYAWPGNIRELKIAIERSFWLKSGRVITPADLDLPHKMPEGGIETDQASPQLAILNGPPIRLGLYRRRNNPSPFTEAEKEQLAQVLEACDGNKRLAAKMLGVSPKTIYNRISEYGLYRFTRKGRYLP